MLDYIQVRCCVIDYLEKKAPEWLVPYTVFLFWTCVEAENRKRRLDNPNKRKLYDSEIKRALKYFSNISVRQIIADPYTGRKKKALAVIGKISFKLAYYANPIILYMSRNVRKLKKILKQ
jgi:hypothetical protein